MGRQWADSGQYGFMRCIYDEVYLVDCMGHKNKLDVTFAMAGNCTVLFIREQNSEVLLWLTMTRLLTCIIVRATVAPKNTREQSSNAFMRGVEAMVKERGA